MSNLFNLASLQVARISGCPPSTADKAQVALLAVPLNPPMHLEGEGQTSAEPAPTSRPQKWLRGASAPDELASLWSRASEVVAAMAGRGAMTKKDKEKKRRLDEGHGPSGAAEFIEGQQPVNPLPHPTEVVVLDDTSPSRQAGGDQETELDASAGHQEESSIQASLPEPDHRPGKEPVGSTSAVGANAAPLQSTKP